MYHIIYKRPSRQKFLRDQLIWEGHLLYGIDKLKTRQKSLAGRTPMTRVPRVCLQGDDPPSLRTPSYIMCFRGSKWGGRIRKKNPLEKFWKVEL